MIMFRRCLRAMCLIALSCIVSSRVWAAKTPITMWFSSQPPAIASWANRFQEAFNSTSTDIELTVHTFEWAQREQLIVNVAAGTAPDLYYDSSNVLGMWVRNGIAKPLDEYLARWPDRNDLIPATLADLKYFGKTYAVPFSVHPYWDMYNMDLAEAAGVSLPDTWDSMIAFAKKLTKIGPTGQPEVFGYSAYSLAGLVTFIDFERCLEQLGTRSIEVDTGAINVNSEAGRQALNYLAEVTLAGMPTYQRGNFNTGNVAVMHWASPRELSDAITAFGGVENTNIALRRYVGPEVGTDVTHYWAGVLFMVSSTKHPEEAWKVLEAWMQPKYLLDYLVAWGTNLPARKSMMNYPELRTGPYSDQIIKVMDGPIIPYGSRHLLYTDFRGPVGDILTEAVQGRLPVPTALEQAERTLKQIVSEAKN